VNDDRSVPPRRDHTPLSFNLDEIDILPVDERIRVLARSNVDSDRANAKAIKDLAKQVHEEFAQLRKTFWQLAVLIFSICFVAGASALVIAGKYMAKIDQHDEQIRILEEHR
jgi:hypothetical protein